VLTFFFSIVPVGPPLIWVPAALWLFDQGSLGLRIFMLVEEWVSTNHRDAGKDPGKSDLPQA